MTFEPAPDKTRHYVPGRCPYVEIVISERKIHARVMAWQGERILVEYPPATISRYPHGQREVLWIHKSEAKRIRREESVWGDPEDDYPWHQNQDEKITYRPDPWTIYEQEFSESK